jgi:hypothetical protein
VAPTWAIHIATSYKAIGDNYYENISRGGNKLINKIIITSLYGEGKCFLDVSAAIGFIEKYNESIAEGEFKRYKVIVEYSNSDRIDAEFVSKGKIIRFLKSL